MWYLAAAGVRGSVHARARNSQYIVIAALRVWSIRYDRRQDEVFTKCFGAVDGCGWKCGEGSGWNTEGCYFGL